MKKIITIMSGMLVLSSLSGLAFAQKEGAYIGGGLGYGSQNAKHASNSDESGFAGRLFVGYNFSEYFGVELAYDQFSNADGKKHSSQNFRQVIIPPVGPTFDRHASPLPSNVNFGPKFGNRGIFFPGSNVSPVNTGSNIEVVGPAPTNVGTSPKTDGHVGPLPKHPATHPIAKQPVSFVDYVVDTNKKYTTTLSSVNLVGKAYLPLSDNSFNLYALAGGAYTTSKLTTKSTVTNSLTGVKVASSKSKTSHRLLPTFGAGVSYAFPGSNVATGVEVSHTVGSSDLPSATLATINLAYNFS